MKNLYLAKESLVLLKRNIKDLRRKCPLSFMSLSVEVWKTFTKKSLILLFSENTKISRWKYITAATNRTTGGKPRKHDVEVETTKEQIKPTKVDMSRRMR